MDAADRIMALQAVPLFAQVDIADLRHIAENVEERRYVADETIFTKGDPDDDLIMIVSGEVHLIGAISPDPRGPGEHIGELALLRHQPRSLTATAGSEGMHALVMDCQVLERLIEARPQIAISMLGTLADILAGVQ